MTLLSLILKKNSMSHITSATKVRTKPSFLLKEFAGLLFFCSAGGTEHSLQMDEIYFRCMKAKIVLKT